VLESSVEPKKGRPGGFSRNNAKSVVQPPLERRRTRWSRRQHAYRLLDWQAAQAGSWDDVPGRRQAGCGRSTIDGQVNVRATITDDGPNAYTEGLQTCGSIWACPVCSAKIRARRSLEVQLAAQRHVALGGTLAMLTLTVRHERRHDLAELVTGLRDAWKTAQQHRRWRPLRSELVGTITALEVTQGPNGWHPHLHLLLFLRPGADGLVDELVEWLPAAWRGLVGSRLDVAPDLAHGTHVLKLGADSAKYVAKIGDETTRADLKSDAKSPFALLDGVGDGDVQAVAQWLDFCRTMKGRRAIVWSRGLRDELLPDVEELSDEEAAAQLVQGVLLEQLHPRTWWQLAMTRTTTGVVRAVAYLEDWERRLMVDQP
jgi:hypothetical protein